MYNIVKISTENFAFFFVLVYGDNLLMFFAACIKNEF